MITFLHAADIHLDSPLRGLETYPDAPVEEIRGASRRAFDNLIDLAIAENVSFIVLAGDLYDGDWLDYNTGLFFVSRMGRLERAGIRVFLVSGNHDAASRITRQMPLPDNVIHFSTSRAESYTLDELRIRLYGRSYPRREVTDNLVVEYPRADSGYFSIGILHTALTGREGHGKYAPCTVSDLLSRNYDYWALGHVHQREVVCEEPWVVFPGNLQGRHIRETGSKGATMVTIADGRVVAISHRELDVLRWAVCRVEVDDCDSEEEIFHAVRRSLIALEESHDGRTLCVRLRLAGRTSLHGSLLEKQEMWLEQFRGICQTQGSLWLEKLEVDTRRPLSDSAFLPTDGPVASLLHSVQNLKLDPQDLALLVPELPKLVKILPAELVTGELPDCCTDEDSRNRLADEVRELLHSGLLRHQEGG